ncbi:MAG: alcohol dehydrogenase catalytic domain-containing protein [Rhodopila sp.]|jgi:alcohol dehydrogenase/propanol-preferring alcohol dehydrogenase
MEAWVVERNGEPLVRIEKPTQNPTGTEVLVEVTHSGVCHSDLHFWEGSYDLGGGRKMMLTERGVSLPRAIGHEILGRVAAPGRMLPASRSATAASCIPGSVAERADRAKRDRTICA